RAGWTGRPGAGRTAEESAREREDHRAPAEVLAQVLVVGDADPTADPGADHLVAAESAADRDPPALPEPGQRAARRRPGGDQVVPAEPVEAVGAAGPPGLGGVAERQPLEAQRPTLPGGAADPLLL